MSPYTCLLKMLQKFLRLTVSEIFQAQLIQKRLFPKCIWCFCIEKFLNFLMISLTVFQCVPCFFSKETVYFRKPLFCRLTEFVAPVCFCSSVGLFVLTGASEGAIISNATHSSADFSAFFLQEPVSAQKFHAYPKWQSHVYLPSTRKQTGFLFRS